MLVAKIELWPWGERPAYPEDLLTQVAIVNDATGSSTAGNYRVYKLREGDDPADQSTWRGRSPDDCIVGFPRQDDQSHTCLLVGRVLTRLGESS